MARTGGLRNVRFQAIKANSRRSYRLGDDNCAPNSGPLTQNACLLKTAVPSTGGPGCSLQEISGGYLSFMSGKRRQDLVRFHHGNLKYGERPTELGGHFIELGGGNF